MKLMDAVSAYIAAEGLMKTPLSYGTAAALVQLRSELRALTDYYIAEEKRLVERYAKKDDEGWPVFSGSNFIFRDPADAPAYNEARKKLGDTEVDKEIEKRRAPAPEKITPEALEQLAPFIEFEV